MSSCFWTNICPRRRLSMASRLATVMSHAAGLAGMPSSGHRSSATTSASWASSSAMPTSRVTRAMAAISRVDSIFHTASIVLFTSPMDLPSRCSALFGGGPEGDLSNLARHAAHLGALAGPLERLLQVGDFQDGDAAHELLGFEVRPVGHHDLAVGLRLERVGRPQPPGEPPDPGGDHLTIERVNPVHHRF